MLEKIINYLNKQIIDVKMKNRMNEHIKNILQEKPTIKLIHNIIIKSKNKEIIVKKQKNNITYIYKEKNYKEKYQIYKIEKEYISEFRNKNTKTISVFNREMQEIIKHIEEQNKETTYIRTHNNNIILIEKTKNETHYYIGINENRYENYLQHNIIFTEIEKEEFINLINDKIEEKELLEKYFLTQKNYIYNKYLF